MKHVRAWLSRVVALFGRARRERELAAELENHLALHIEDNLRAGMTAEESRRQALIKLGGLEQAKELYRERRGITFLETLWQDFRYGARMLRKSPGFTAVAVFTLALGIGANTAIFTLVKEALLQPLPVRAANRLVVIWVNNSKAGWSRMGPTGQDYLDWREESRSFEDLFLFEHGSGTVTGGGEPEQVAGLRVTTNFGDFFGIKPILGRTFRVDEAGARHNLAILAYRYWQRRYGGDPSVVGRGITLNGEPYTIIGVLPPEMNTLFPTDIVVPFDSEWLKRVDSDLGVLGRIKKGVTLEQASSEMSLIMERIARQRPSRQGYGAVLVPLESARVEYIRPALLVLLCAVGFVLLIACANVSNLLLERAIGRQREVAVRMALGAGRVRLVRQFLVESMFLGLLGGAAGLFLAVWSTYALARYVPSRIPVPNAADQAVLPRAHVDATALVFAVIVSLLAGIVFGLIPALQSMRFNVEESLKDGERGLAGRHGHRTRAALVIVEGALACVLAIGAGLMLRSFSRLLATSPGFRTDHLLTFRIKLPNDAKDSKYRDPRQRSATFARFLRAVQAAPGVKSAALTEIVPLSQDDMDMGFFVIKEQPPLAPGMHMAADYRDVSPGYFHTMGIPLIEGRTFAEHDNVGSPRVVIIDATLARRLFPNQDPLGEHLQVPDATRPEREIVGVVGAVRDTGFDQQPRPTIYFPLGQTGDQTMSLVVSTMLPPESILPIVKSAIWSVDSNQPVFNVRTMGEIVSEVTSARRIAFLALDIFTFLGLVLAAVGIYGVTSYAVSQRTHEIGVRMVLGAQPGDVLRLVVGHGVKPALWGVGIGLLGSFALTRLMASLLYGVSSTDQVTYATVAILLAGVGLVASYVPARRAMRMDPTTALRHE
ncbi:MAG: ABC transporter permease [Acidobacteriota bacterium]|nr:ABC transporter permease [Acidobacteriota bacterium]